MESEKKKRERIPMEVIKLPLGHAQLCCIRVGLRHHLRNFCIFGKKCTCHRGIIGQEWCFPLFSCFPFVSNWPWGWYSPMQSRSNHIRIPADFVWLELCGNGYDFRGSQCFLKLLFWVCLNGTCISCSFLQRNFLLRVKMFQLKLFSIRGKCLKAQPNEHCFINSDLKSNFLCEPMPLKHTLILEAHVLAVKMVSKCYKFF